MSWPVPYEVVKYLRDMGGAVINPESAHTQPEGPEAPGANSLGRNSTNLEPVDGHSEGLVKFHWVELEFLNRRLFI